MKVDESGMVAAHVSRGKVRLELPGLGPEEMVSVREGHSILVGIGVNGKQMLTQSPDKRRSAAADALCPGVPIYYAGTIGEENIQHGKAVQNTCPTSDSKGSRYDGHGPERRRVYEWSVADGAESKSPQSLIGFRLPFRSPLRIEGGIAFGREPTINVP